MPRQTSKRSPAAKSSKNALAKRSASSAQGRRASSSRTPQAPSGGGRPVAGKMRENAGKNTLAGISAEPARPARGKYVYCIIQAHEPLRFGPSSIGNEVAEVHTINYRDLAAVVSEVPIGVLDSTRDNVLAHEHVNETVMRDHTVIPMSFGTIFKTREDIVELLRSAYDAFGDVLAKMRNKLEFGLKVLWEREPVIREIEAEDEDIHRLKNEISSHKGSTYFARMQYGRAIDAALEARSERYVAEILNSLRDVSVASRINKPIGDKMIMNAAFLISRDQEAEFDARVKEISGRLEKLTFRYTGPWPPYNFVNIRLKLERA